MYKRQRNGKPLLEAYKTRQDKKGHIARNFSKVIMRIFDAMEDYTKTEEFRKEASFSMTDKVTTKPDDTEEFLNFVIQIKVDSFNQEIIKVFSLFHLNETINENSLKEIKREIMRSYEMALNKEYKEGREFFRNAIDTIINTTLIELDHNNREDKTTTKYEQNVPRFSGLFRQ